MTSSKYANYDWLIINQWHVCEEFIIKLHVENESLNLVPYDFINSIFGMLFVLTIHKCALLTRYCIVVGGFVFDVWWGGH